MAKRKMCCLPFFCLILIGLFASYMDAFPGIVSDLIYESFDGSFEEIRTVSETGDYLAKSKYTTEMGSKGTPKKPRFLCLHGHGSNATLLKDHLKNWPDFVLDKMDLVFINGPFSTDEANEQFVVPLNGAVAKRGSGSDPFIRSPVLDVEADDQLWNGTRWALLLGTCLRRSSSLSGELCTDRKGVITGFGEDEHGSFLEW